MRAWQAVAWHQVMKMDWGSIGTRVTVVLGTLIAALTISATVSLVSTNRLAAGGAQLASEAFDVTAKAGEVVAQMRQGRLWQFRAQSAQAPAQRVEYLDNATKEFDVVSENLTTLKDSAHDPAVAKALTVISDEWTTYREQSEEFAALVNGNKPDEAAGYLTGPMGSLMTEKMAPAIDEFEKSLHGYLDSESSRAAANASRVQVIMGCLNLAVLILAGYSVVFIRTRVAKPVRKVSELIERVAAESVTSVRSVAQALAHCDLSQRVTLERDEQPVHGRDEVARLTQAYNALDAGLVAVVDDCNKGFDRLADMISRIDKAALGSNKKSLNVSKNAVETSNLAQEVRSSVEQVTSATEESARASQDIAKGSQQLAATASEATQSAEALVAAVHTVKQSAIEQLEATQAAEITAKTGSAAVEDTISSMERIDQQVSASADAVRELGAKQAQIGAIVETISAISAQTNLLALNAAIEAARAGEHGRGFAVVADEVRKLAERASEATGEISELIDSVRAGVETAIQSMEQSASEVREGTAHSAEAKKALAEILTSAEALRTAAASSSSLVEQMSVETASVQDLIASVAAVSQETAAGAQEVSASSEQVSATAAEMARAVDAQVAEIEQVSLLADELCDSSSDLRVLVSTFRVSQDENLDSRLETAKTGHRIWVKKMRKMLDGRDKFDDKSVGDHHKCALGLWYYQLGAAEFSHLPEFQAIEGPHAELHAKLPEVIRTYNAGKHAEAEQRFKELEAISGRVIASLDAFGRAAGASRSGSNREAA